MNDIRVPNHVARATEHIADRVTGRPNKTLRVIMSIVIIVAGLAVIAAIIVGILTRTGVISEPSAINKDENQAVFLTNGQVYFGKLQNVKGDYLTLTNIYYLQVDSTDPSIQSGANSNSNNVQLIKLGNELHGPNDEMQISSKQVLFWENLKNDSKVSQAIANYKEDK